MRATIKKAEEQKLYCKEEPYKKSKHAENNEIKNKQMTNENIFLSKEKYLQKKKIMTSSLQVKENLIKSENKIENKQS